MTANMKLLSFTRFCNQTTQIPPSASCIFPALISGLSDFCYLLLRYESGSRGLYGTCSMHMSMPLHKKSLQTLEPQCWQERSDCVLLKNSSLKIRSLFLSAFLHFKTVVVTCSICKTSEGEPEYKVYYSALIHKIKSPVRRLVYLTLYNFLHSISSANPCDSTGDNNLSLSLYPVEPTDLITSLLTNRSLSFIDVNYPFLSDSRSD